MGDGIVYNDVWDETAKELVSNPSNGDGSDIFAPNFLMLVTDLSYEHPPTAELFLFTP